MADTEHSLYNHLNHKPQVLQFGTSGRRGLVIHLTQLEIYINAYAELEYLQSLTPAEGGIRKGDVLYFAYDLRPSSTQYVASEQGRGEIAQAIVKAIRDAGMEPVNLGQIPTPALTAYALSQGKGSIMITGSHIPFDRNGYKTNTSVGELLKIHEGPINAKVQQLREALYQQDFADSAFDENGRLKVGHQALPAESDAAKQAYLNRYVNFFGPEALAGLNLLFYQHSAVGRDLVPELLRLMGAKVICAGRSETFIPIDTENLEAAQLQTIQTLQDETAGGPFDAILSTDGDSDRPLILGLEGGKVRFFGGDLVGMITAQFLGADAVAVPISCNDGIDRGVLKGILCPKTQIGSPFVIARMGEALAQGKKTVCGFEANGGFLTGSVIEKQGKTLAPLPTRDAVLPMLCVLASAKSQGVGLSLLFDALPKRYSRAALIKNFPKPVSQKIVARFSPTDTRIKEVNFKDPQVELKDGLNQALSGLDAEISRLQEIKEALAGFFTPDLGFSAIARLNYIDGVRIYFDSGEVAHLRPSGNADELRIYAVTDEQIRSDAIAKAAIAEPDGILRRLERLVS